MVYVFIAEGFEEMEALCPVDCMRRAGLEVQTVGVTGKTVRGRSGITIETDRTDIETDDRLQMIVLPGGMPGADNLAASETVSGAISFCAEHNRFIAAICAAPYILGDCGLLEGRRATCYPGFEPHLRGAECTGAGVCVDGNIITAKGAGYAIDFGLELVRALCGKDKADAVRASIY